MAVITRESREIELLEKVKTETGCVELLKKLKFQLGLQPDQSLPPGASLVGELLEREFGASKRPK